jgi:hypothetical protein
VNGRDLGLYVHVESIDRHWVRRPWERDEGELWEGELSDFREGWMGTFEKKGDVPDDDQKKADRRNLGKVTAALGRHDHEVRAWLEEQIDFEEFMRFWAAEKILEHWDGYANGTNNFILYRDPATERFVFAPTGTDQITVVDPFSPVQPPVSVYADSAIANRLYEIPETRELYAATLRQLLDTAFREEDLLAEIDRMQALVAPVVARSGPETAAAQAAAVEDLRTWVRGRRAVLLADLANGPPEWSQPLPASICIDLLGDLAGSFATSFGTPEGADLFATGTGTLTGVYRRVPLSISRVGAGAHFDRNATEDPWPVVDLVGLGADGKFYNVWIGLNPQRLAPGARGTFDGEFAWGGIGNWNPVTYQWTFMGSFVEGSIEIGQAGVTPGDPVSGRFAATVVMW